MIAALATGLKKAIMQRVINPDLFLYRERMQGEEK